MASIEVGIRIDPEKGIAFFGLEDVNQRIASGARVIELRPGGAVMNRAGESADGDRERLALAGGQFEVVFEDA